MSRRVRRNQVFTVGMFDAAEATGDVLLDGAAPSDGAMIDYMDLSVKITGIGSGTYDFMLEELGTSVALTEKASSVDPDSAANTVMTRLQGNGVGVTAAGVGLQMQVTENGTVSTGTFVNYCIWWLN